MATRKPTFYYLEGTTPIGTYDITEYAEKHTPENSQIAKDIVHDYLVSTVFLGIDHGFMSPEPVLFETMCFVQGEQEVDYRFDEDLERYCTYEEALAGHAKKVAEIKKYFKTSYKLKKK